MGKNSRKGKQKNKCRENIIGLKNKITKKKTKNKKQKKKENQGKKGKPPRTAKAQCRGRGL